MTNLINTATRINQEYAAANAAADKAVAHAFTCGELLTTAKASVPHGEWGKWLADNTVVADRTARAWMQLARLPAAKRHRVADLSLRDALKEIADSSPKSVWVSGPSLKEQRGKPLGQSEFTAMLSTKDREAFHAAQQRFVDFICYSEDRRSGHMTYWDDTTDRLAEAVNHGNPADIPKALADYSGASHALSSLTPIFDREHKRREEEEENRERHELGLSLGAYARRQMHLSKEDEYHA